MNIYKLRDSGISGDYYKFYKKYVQQKKNISDKVLISSLKIEFNFRSFIIDNASKCGFSILLFI